MWFRVGAALGCRSSRVVSTLAVTLAILGLVLSASPVRAGKGWCRVDPVVVIDGQIADIFVGSTPSAFRTTTGPIKMIVTVPQGTKAVKVISDLGFGRGYDFSFAESSDLVETEDGIPVRVDVYVPATKDSLPITVYFAPRLVGVLWPATVDGHANSWVSLTAHV